MHKIRLIPKVKWLRGGGGVTSKIYKGEEDADIPNNTEHKSKRLIRRERKKNLSSTILDYKDAVANADSMVEINDIYNQILQNKSNYTDREFNKIMNKILPAFQSVIRSKKLRNVTGLTKQQELDYPFDEYSENTLLPFEELLNPPPVLSTTPPTEEYIDSYEDGDEEQPDTELDQSWRNKYLYMQPFKITTDIPTPTLDIKGKPSVTQNTPKNVTPAAKAGAVKAKDSATKPYTKIDTNYEKQQSLKLTPAISYGEEVLVWDKDAQRSYYFVSRGVSDGIITLKYIQRNGDTPPAIKSFTMPVSIFNKYYNPRYDRSTNTKNGIISINSLANKSDTPLLVFSSNLKDNSFAEADRERGNNTDFTLMTW